MPAARRRSRTAALTITLIVAGAAALAGCANTNHHSEPIRTTNQDLKRYQTGVSDELGSYLLAYQPREAMTRAARPQTLE